MFEKYKATEEDLSIIEEGIRTVWRKELSFIFEDKKIIKKTSVISFDSFFIYLWTPIKILGIKHEFSNLPNYYFFRIPHKVSIEDSNYSVWYATIFIKEFYKFLPEIFTESQRVYPRISGGPPFPFLKFHQEMRTKKEFPLDPYITKESFLATVVHEFAHVYFESQYFSWHGIKSYNLRILEVALNSYRGKEQKRVQKIKIKLPVSYHISELFAFCAEDSAAKIFWPTHYKNLNLFEANKLEKLIKKERKRNLNWEYSVIDEDSHSFAAIIGKILTTQYPTTWPKIIYSHCPP